MVERIDVSPDYMESERVARFADLKSSAKAFVDALIPGYERDIYNIIGRGVVEDKELEPPITDNRDFNVGLIKCEPGKGASLHIHEDQRGLHPADRQMGHLLAEQRRAAARGRARTLRHRVGPHRREPGLPQCRRRDGAHAGGGRRHRPRQGALAGRDHRRGAASRHRPRRQWRPRGARRRLSGRPERPIGAAVAGAKVQGVHRQGPHPAGAA